MILSYGGISPEPPAASSPFPTLQKQSPGAGRSADADFASLKIVSGNRSRNLPSGSASMCSTGALHTTRTPASRNPRSSVRTICMASWLTGKTHWSGCVVSRTPSASNQRCVSAGLSTRRARRIRCAPRGYTSSSRISPGSARPLSATSRKLLVRLHRPPPVTATLASSLGPASKTVTSASGRARFTPMAQKQPAAPPPMTATFIVRRRLRCPGIPPPRPCSTAGSGRRSSGRGSRWWG